MARLDRAAIVAKVCAAVGATPDPDGTADLVAERGHINVAASGGELKGAIQRLKTLPGYRWIAINEADLFTASPLTLGTKIGILDPNGRVLKAADLPRPQ
jgi:hypothetical protein